MHIEAARTRIDAWTKTKERKERTNPLTFTLKCVPATRSLLFVHAHNIAFSLFIYSKLIAFLYNIFRFRIILTFFIEQPNFEWLASQILSNWLTFSITGKTKIRNFHIQFDFKLCHDKELENKCWSIDMWPKVMAHFVIAQTVLSFSTHWNQYCMTSCALRCGCMSNNNCITTIIKLLK